jgi:hypothetical protein
VPLLLLLSLPLLLSWVASHHFCCCSCLLLTPASAWLPVVVLLPLLLMVPQQEGLLWLLLPPLPPALLPVYPRQCRGGQLLLQAPALLLEVLLQAPMQLARFQQLQQLLEPLCPHPASFWQLMLRVHQ